MTKKVVSLQQGKLGLYYSRARYAINMRRLSFVITVRRATMSAPSSSIKVRVLHASVVNSRVRTQTLRHEKQKKVIKPGQEKTQIRHQQLRNSPRSNCIRTIGKDCYERNEQAILFLGSLMG